MRWIRKPALYAGQAAFLLRRKEPRPKVEKALRETLTFWARYDGIALPPLLTRAHVQAFEEAFVQQLQFKPRTENGTNAAALDAVRSISIALGWEPF